jgi:hypothetical protein
MKVSEFKKILKPLIRQTVKEVILDEGLLSGIVSEVAQGLQGSVITEEKEKRHISVSEIENSTKHEEERQRRIKKLNESAKIGDVFKGTRELPEHSKGALSGMHPEDSGVDITAIQKIASGKWKHLM